MASKKAALSAKAEKLIQSYESKAQKLNEKAESIRDKYEAKADNIRDHYQAKADALKEKGFDHLAAKFEKIGEMKASKIEKIGEHKAGKLEKLADKYQAKADKLKGKIKDDDLDEDDLDDKDDLDDDDDADENDDDADEGAVEVKFFVDANGDGTPYYFIEIEAPEDFDPNNPDFDQFFDEVQSQMEEFAEMFPWDDLSTDPVTAVIQATVFLPDGTAIDFPNPFADDETMSDLSTGEASDDFVPEEEEEDMAEV